MVWRNRHKGMAVREDTENHSPVIVLWCGTQRPPGLGNSCCCHCRCRSQLRYSSRPPGVLCHLVPSPSWPWKTPTRSSKSWLNITSSQKASLIPFQTEQITLLQVSTSLCKWPDLEQITHYYEPSVKRGWDSPRRVREELEIMYL